MTDKLDKLNTTIDAQALLARANSRLESARLRRDDKDQGLALVQRSGAHLLQGALAAAIEDLEASIACFEAAGAEEDAARGRVHLSFLLRGSGQKDAADAHLDALGEGTDTLPADVRARYDAERAERSLQAGRTNDAIDAFAQSYETHLQAGDGDQAQRAVLARVDLFDVMGEPARADQALDAAIEDPAFTPFPKNQLTLRLVRTLRHLLGGQEDAAHDKLEAIYRDARAHQLPDVEIRARLAAARAWIDLDQPDKSFPLINGAIAVAVRVVDPIGFAEASKLLAQTHAVLGQYPEAVGALLRCRATLDDLQPGLGSRDFQTFIDYFRETLGPGTFDRAQADFFEKYDVKP